MTNITTTLSQIRDLYRPRLEQWIQLCVSGNNDKNMAFFTLHFDGTKKDIDAAKEYYRKILGAIFVQMCGKKWWCEKNILPGITIIEHGKRGFLHCHSIINMQDKTAGDITRALDYVTQHDKRFKLAYGITDEFPLKNDVSYKPQKNHLLIQMPIKKLNHVIGYVLKEYDFTKNKIDFSNFFPHQMLFDKDLIYAKKRNIKYQYKP